VAVQGGDKDHDLLQSKCLRNALVHDGLMTSTATNDSAPPPTSALAPAGPAAMEGGGKDDDDTLPLDFWKNDDLAVAASCVHLPLEQLDGVEVDSGVGVTVPAKRQKLI